MLPIPIIQEAGDIIDPVAAVNPLLGAIVAMLVAGIVYMAYQNRIKDEEIRALRDKMYEDAQKQIDSFREMPGILERVWEELQRRTN